MLGETDEKYKRIVNIAGVLEGLYRQAGMHAGGVVIGRNLGRLCSIFLSER